MDGTKDLHNSKTGTGAWAMTKAKSKAVALASRPSGGDYGGDYSTPDVSGDASFGPQ